MSDLVLTKPAPVALKKPPKPLDAKTAYERMVQLEDRTRVLVEAEHRRLRRAKIGATSFERQQALIRSLTNLDPVLQTNESRLKAMQPGPAAVRPLLAARLQRVRQARAKLKSGLAAARRGQRSFDGWSDAPGSERALETTLRRKLGLGHLARRERAATGFDARRNRSTHIRYASTRAEVPPINRFADPFGPSRREVARDRAFVLLAGRVIPMLKGHNWEVLRFGEEMRVNLPSDPVEREIYVRAKLREALAKDEAFITEFVRLGHPTEELATYVRAIQTQFASGHALGLRYLESGLTIQEMAAGFEEFLRSPLYLRQREAVRLAADGVNARLRVISARGTATEEDWAALKRTP